MPVEYNGHQHRAVEQVFGRVDQGHGFFLAQDNRQTAWPLRVGHFLHRIRPLQRLDVEEPNGRRVRGRGSDSNLALFDQIRLIAPDLFGSQLIRRFAEVLRVIGYRLHLGAHGRLSVITTLEFLQHHLS